MYKNTNFTMVAVALTAMLFNTDLTQAQSDVSYDTSSHIEWIETATMVPLSEVVYATEITPIEFVTATYAAPIEAPIAAPIAAPSVDYSVNPIYEVEPPNEVENAVAPRNEIQSTSVQPAEPTNTVASPVAHTTPIETYTAAPVAIPAPAPAVQEMPIIPVANYFPTHQPVCMSGG